MRKAYAYRAAKNSKQIIFVFFLFGTKSDFDEWILYGKRNIDHLSLPLSAV